MKWKDELMAAFRKLKGAFESPLKLRPVTKREELKLNNAADRPALLDLIGQKESNGKYNAFYGNANNEDIKFTEMKVSDVRSWQDRFVRNGSDSSAVGKYQIIRKTMDSLISDLNLTGDELFDEELQDKMALQLAKRRGYDKWKNGSLDDNAFANNLAKEWASFPVVGGNKHGRSYYAGDGLNKALISPDEVLRVLDNDRRKLSDAVATA